MSQETPDKLRDDLFFLRAEFRRKSILNVLSDSSTQSEAIHKAELALEDVSQQIICAEDVEDDQMNSLRLRVLESMRTMTADILESHEADFADLIARHLDVLNRFWDDIMKMVQELGRSRNDSMSRVRNQYEIEIHEIIAAHAQDRAELIRRIDSLRIDSTNSLGALSREKSRLVHLRRKTESLVRPFMSLQQDIASMKERLAYHKTAVQPKLDPAKRRYMYLKEKIKEAKFDLEILLHRKEIAEKLGAAFDFQSVSTCES
jgi:hypothetical protein